MSPPSISLLFLKSRWWGWQLKCVQNCRSDTRKSILFLVSAGAAHHLQHFQPMVLLWALTNAKIFSLGLWCLQRPPEVPAFFVSNFDKALGTCTILENSEFLCVSSKHATLFRRQQNSNKTFPSHLLWTHTLFEIFKIILARFFLSNTPSGNFILKRRKNKSCKTRITE